MALTQQQKEEHAARIIHETARGIEYSAVYEDDRIEEDGATESEMEAIYSLIHDALVKVAF